MCNASAPDVFEEELFICGVYVSAEHLLVVHLVHIVTDCMSLITKFLSAACSVVFNVLEVCYKCLTIKTSHTKAKKIHSVWVQCPVSG